MNIMGANTFISHRLFVAALGHDDYGDTKRASPDRPAGVETNKAGPDSVWQIKPVSEPQPVIATRRQIAFGFTGGR